MPICDEEEVYCPSCGENMGLNGDHCINCDERPLEEAFQSILNNLMGGAKW